MEKSILVVGATGGIGRVVARHFLDKGWYVYGTRFTEDPPEYLEHFETNLVPEQNFTPLDLDLRNQQEVERLLGSDTRLQAVVNCAGVVEFEELNKAEDNIRIMDSTLAVNFRGSLLLFEFLRHNINPGGSYIMISSTDSYFGGRVSTTYAASKAAVNSLTKSLALRFQDSKIRVNSIAPGWVEMVMMDEGGEELVKYAADINPLKRNGKPQDVANLAELLIDSKSEYINGQIISLDGGYTLQDPTLIFEEQQIEKN